MRTDGRAENKLRRTSVIPGYTKHAEGSVLIKTGDTHVLCNATVEDGVPPFLKDSGRGWVTAEYSMLPRSTGTRTQRDISRLKLSPRSAEIQRLIGRALRSVCDLSLMPGISVIVDCDVLQADGGTRTASVTGAYIALWHALEGLVRKGALAQNPVREQVAAVSVGIVDGVPLLDLCYEEDSAAEADFNVVLSSGGGIVEVQGTGEQRPFTEKEMDRMLKLAKSGVRRLFAVQRKYTLELLK